MSNSNTSATMKDVAKEAGVSLGTVSKVFNGIPVGDSYRQRVEKAAKKLNYQVNIYARGLRANKTSTVALILPSIKHPFFAALADEITATLMRRGYKTMLMITNYDPEAEEKCISMVRQNKADGMIALTYNPDLQVDESLNYVSLDRSMGDRIPCVASDNFAGGGLAAEKLLELGCKKLLFLRIGTEVAGEADKRGVGFVSYCQMRGVEYETMILNDSDTEEPFYRFLEQHFAPGKADFDGIFCNTDLLACRIVEKLRSIGSRVPEEVQVIGFDGVVNYTTGRPYCSTIVQPLEKLAEAAVGLLLNDDYSKLSARMYLPVSYASGGTTRD